jgi:hypothetical protein
MRNPWTRLRRTPPFVLPEDKVAVLGFNDKVGRRHPRYLHVENILPEVFVGNPNAPVVMLGNNPGVTNKGLSSKQDATFMRRMRRNLCHKLADYPFVFLAPDFNGPGKRWWTRKLGYLVKCLGETKVAQAVFAVEYFPYPSRKYGHRRLCPLRCQEYSFRLVRKAMGRQAFIFLMRGERRWTEAVKGLSSYKRLICLNNPQRPRITKNTERVEEVIQAINDWLSTSQLPGRPATGARD